MTCWIPLSNDGRGLQTAKSHTFLQFPLASPLESTFSPFPVSPPLIPPAFLTFKIPEQEQGIAKPFHGAGSQGLQTSCKGEAMVGTMGDGASGGAPAHPSWCCSLLGHGLSELGWLRGDFRRCISQGCSLVCLRQSNFFFAPHCSERMAPKWKPF